MAALGAGIGIPLLVSVIGHDYLIGRNVQKPNWRELGATLGRRESPSRRLCRGAPTKAVPDHANAERRFGSFDLFDGIAADAVLGCAPATSIAIGPPSRSGPATHSSPPRRRVHHMKMHLFSCTSESVSTTFDS